jgi:hypothetical protein
MRFLGFILAVSLALALLRVALVFIFVVYVTALVVSFIVRPKETFGLLAFLICCSMLQQHPLATLGTLAIWGIATAISKVNKDG